MEPRRILIVEDEPCVALVARKVLERCGYRSDSVRTVAGACAALEAGSFDAVICDLRLPGARGETLIEWLRDRGDPLLAHTLVVTADPVYAASDRVDGTPVPVLRKPFDIHEFANAVQGILRAAAA